MCSRVLAGLKGVASGNWSNGFQREKNYIYRKSRWWYCLLFPVINPGSAINSVCLSSILGQKSTFIELDGVSKMFRCWPLATVWGGKTMKYGKWSLHPSVPRATNGLTLFISSCDTWVASITWRRKWVNKHSSFKPVTSIQSTCLIYASQEVFVSDIFPILQMEGKKKHFKKLNIVSKCI